MRAAVFLSCLTLLTNSLGQSAPSDLEIQMVHEVNMVRTAPSAYRPYVLEWLEQTEAVDSVRAIAKLLLDTLERIPPMSPLEFSDSLYAAAIEQGKWMRQVDQFDHSNSIYAENLVAGHDLPRFAVIDLLVDEGVPDRGHRWIILDPGFSRIACHYVESLIEGFEHTFIQEFD